MPALIFDIETVGEDFDALDDTTREMLTRWLKRETYDEDEYQNALLDIKNGLGFSPLTGQIAAIGILDADKEKGAVYYQTPNQPVSADEETDGIVFKQKTETEMLEQFWQIADQYDTFVSFNGRGFDVPYLMIRSAINKIKPTKNLLSNRYLSMQRGAYHVDLMDQLSFYGAVRKRGSLHLYCRAFGIQSPKASGVTGDDVAGLFKERKFLEIARYNVGDLKATRELYRYWRDFINV